MIQVMTETGIASKLLELDADWELMNLQFLIGSSIASVLVDKQTLINVEEEKEKAEAQMTNW